MSQYDFGNLSSPLPGSALVDTHLEPWRNALHTMHSGTSRPSYAVAGMKWLDTTGTPWIIKMFDGTDDIALGTVNATTNKFSIPVGSGYDVQQQRKFVYTSRDTTVASGTQAITGAGFTPRGFNVRMAAAGGGESGRISIGFYDGTNGGCQYRNVATGNWGLSGAYVVIVQDAAGSTQYLGSISSLDSDGCTISWTKVGSPTGSITLLFEFWR